jgi:hypothetical protein
MSMGVTVAVRVLFAGCMDVHVHILARCERKCTSLARPQCDAARSVRTSQCALRTQNRIVN